MFLLRYSESSERWVVLRSVYFLIQCHQGEML